MNGKCDMSTACMPMVGDANTLYFIGNGFDLYHNVKSKFIHFYSWLNLQDCMHEQFVADMERLFPNTGVHGNLLWMEFEKALGLFDIESVHNLFSGIEKNDEYDENYQIRSASFAHKTFAKIPVYLKEWVEQISIDTVKPVLPLGKDSIYLTFNYTRVLEEVYNIDSKKILHIHNDLKSDSPLIFGHITDFPAYYDEVENHNIQKSYENLSKEIAGIKKPVQDIIEKNQEFFKSLGQINRVVIFGHSLSTIDRAFFMEALHHVHDNANWFFMYYDDSVKYQYESLVNYYSLYNESTCGDNRYKNKMKPENCRFISVANMLM